MVSFAASLAWVGQDEIVIGNDVLEYVPGVVLQNGSGEEEDVRCRLE